MTKHFMWPMFSVKAMPVIDFVIVTVPFHYIKKTVPLEGWAGSEGFRSLRLPYFKTVGT